MNASRRRFLQATMGLAAGWALQPVIRAEGASQSKKIPIALQLYAVRGDFARDVPGTLKAVSKLGYEGVEFWGYAGTPNVFQDYSAKQLRKLLDNNGLKCCGMHHQLKALEPEKFGTTVENNRILGNRFLVVAAAQERMSSEDAILGFAAMLNETARKLRTEKMRVGYHSHPFDFAKIEGRFAWDILFGHTDPEVIMQLDVGNCLAGKGDPLAMLRKFPGRTLSIHIKEHQEKKFDGKFYQEIFKLCETSCKTEWYIVEMGGDDGVGMDIPRQALADLHRLGK
ncbi:MAG: TIM barrel protein [Thermoguttaceae bacterium]